MNVPLYEKMWLWASAVIIAGFAITVAVGYGASALQPPSHVETIDPTKVWSDPRFQHRGVTATSEGATVTYERSGVIERRAMIVSSATGYRLLNEKGNTLAEVEYAADGTLTVLDHDCQVMQRWTDDQLRLLVQGHGAALGESVPLLSAK